jgi:hypothetical protein
MLGSCRSWALLYTTRAPAGTFPPSAGKFTLSSRQKRSDDPYFPNVRRLAGEYFSPDTNSVTYWVYDFTSQEAARAALEKTKNNLEQVKNKYNETVITDQDRALSVGPTGSSNLYWVNGSFMHHIFDQRQRVVLELEAALRNRPAAQAIIPKPSGTPRVDALSSSAGMLLIEFRYQPERFTKKYQGKWIDVVGEVDSITPEKTGESTVRMTERKYSTGAVICTFKDSNFQKLKVGKVGPFRGMFDRSIKGSVFLKDCTEL